MAETGTRADPPVAFRFTVKFDNMAPIGFSDCSGLQSEIETLEYAEGGLNTHTWKFAGRTKHGNLTFKRGIVDMQTWKWFQKIASGDFDSRNCTICVKDASGTKDLLEFQHADAFPVKWQGPELAAGQNNLSIETMEVAHQGLVRRS
jgi:phage tail-like protein